MNLLYIFGNGFDVNLDLSTKYSDFYKIYKEISDSDHDLIRTFKSEIDPKNDTWADLELALGRYTSKTKTAEDFEKIWFHLSKEFRTFIAKKESELLLVSDAQEIFINHLINPENFLSPRERNELLVWAHQTFQSTSRKLPIDILTLNYTRTVETILGEGTVGNDIGDKFSKKVMLRSVEHIHGYIDDRLIFGVNDISQIENTEFRDNLDITELIVKPLHNHELGHTKDDECERLINSANLICVFGCSLGRTDLVWWERIANRLNPSCRLIIFHYSDDPDLDPDHPILIRRIKRVVTERFLDLVDFKGDARAKAEKEILVAVNTELFQNIKQST